MKPNQTKPNQPNPNQIKQRERKKKKKEKKRKERSPNYSSTVNELLSRAQVTEENLGWYYLQYYFAITL